MISGFWIRVFVSLPILFLSLVLAGAAGGQTADLGLFVPADDPGLPAASLIPSAGGRPVDDGLTARSRRVFVDPVQPLQVVLSVSSPHLDIHPHLAWTNLALPSERRRFFSSLSFVARGLLAQLEGLDTGRLPPVISVELDLEPP